MPSVFSRIIQGEIPCYKIYEDEFVFALLAKDQIHLGHVLVVPKVEIDYFIDVPEPYYSAVFQAAQKIAPAIQKATECLRVGLMVDGREVPHFHLHLVPLNEFDALGFEGAKTYPVAEMEEIREKIVGNI
ncbi:MAG: HIT domain-containing protein [Patescibacteria group bacterium]